MRLSEKYEAQVVLNNGYPEEIRSDKVKLAAGKIFIREQTPGFENSQLKPFDYYPNLGAKTIVIRGELAGGAAMNSGRIRAEVTYPYAGWDIHQKIHLSPTEADLRAGQAEFTLQADQDVTPNDLDQIEIKFTYLADGIPRGSITREWKIRNNSDVKYGEVQRGEAVFVFDDQAGPNHAGITPANVIDDNERRFDFVQELLNQVVPRKRSLNNLYTLQDENGIFSRDLANPGNNTLQALYYLKEHFQIDNTSNPQWDFTKMMRDYNIPEGDYLIWTNRIVDKRTLAGDTPRIEGQVLDNRINGNGGADTGLYELYVNVVKVFARAMIELEEYYAGERGIAGNTAPTLNWHARTGEGPAVHGNGMSYCYGCKNDIGQFNANVANCASPSRSPMASYNLYYINNNAVLRTGNLDLFNLNGADTVPTNYRGNVHETACTLTGDRNYPGLYAHELNSWSYGGNTYFRNRNPASGLLMDPWPSFPQFNPEHWAGIDCSGLAQRGVHNGRTALPGLVDITIPVPGGPMTWIRARDFFADERYVYFLPIPTGNSVAETQERNRILKIAKKSDLLGYGNPVGHIVTMYTEKPTVVGDQVMYKVIHANGSPSYSYPNYDPHIPNTVFSRKVMATWQNFGSTPKCFGRIKFWN